MQTLPKRILLKLSGETLVGHQNFGIQPQACMQLANSIRHIQQLGIQIGVVIGGGNIFRGANLHMAGISRISADHMGMLATIMNGLAVQQALMSLGIKVCLMSALECPQVAESYNWRKALQYLEQGTVLIFVGGTGNPYFTTDTAAALRASEIQANVLLKATKVNGIYNCDPLKNPQAIKYDRISYSQVLAEKLQVMDATAIALCQNNQIPIFVFNMKCLLEDKLETMLTDYSHGTWVDNRESE